MENTIQVNIFPKFLPRNECILEGFFIPKTLKKGGGVCPKYMI